MDKNEIKEKANKILIEIGDTKVYEDYGIKITSLEPYVPTDDNIPTLRDVTIYQNYHLMYDSALEIHNPGKWEDIVSETYEKIPVLKRLKEEKRRKKEIESENKEKGIQIYKDVISQIDFSKLTIYENLFKTAFISRNLRLEKTLDYEKDCAIYRVYKNMRLVYHATHDIYGGTEVKKCEPGPWIDEMKEYIEKIRERDRQKELKIEAIETKKLAKQQRESDKEAEKSLKRLRKVQ